MWVRAIEGIRNLRAYCASAKVGIRTTVNSLNVEEYEEIIKVAEELGVDVLKFNPIRCFGRAQQHQHLLIDQQQYVHFLKGVQKTKSSIRVSLPKTPLDQREYDFVDVGFGCTGGKETCNITPCGDFSPCAFICTTCEGVQSFRNIPLESDFGHLQLFIE